MNPALLRLTQRYINRRLFQSLLFVLGIALGVAVGVAIDLANTSASRAFSLSVDSVSGQTTHQVVGGPGGLPTDLYRELRVDLGLQTSAPVIESYVSGPEGRALRLLGVDPLAEAPFRSYLNTGTNSGSAEGLYALITTPHTVLISEDLAAALDLVSGDTFALQTRTQADVEVQVAGIMRSDDDSSAQAFDNLLLADIATAQELTGQPDRITRIDLILPDDYDLALIESRLPPGAALTTPNASSEALTQMTDAFELNLRALSLLALIVGTFLIYNTVTFSVVQRRQVIGILRSLGTTRRQVFALILSEALILGIIGTGLGLGLGIIMGQGAVRLVAQTINDLYFRVSVQTVTIDPLVLLKGGAIGLTASVVAAIVPSLEATRTPPAGVMRRSSVEQGARRLLPYVSGSAVVLVGVGVLLLRLPTDNVLASFTALFIILFGCALLTPL
ncbi:MAG: FtsX-like permease family protein, partial [Chloroflexi bacterium]|nr:FtsX-like permease family protein [Chloroflexota bacterium]